MDLFNLQGKRILVTGASSGIGQATALVLDGLGADLVLVGRDQERLVHTKTLCQGPNHVVITRDLSQNLEQIPKWVSSMASAHGRLSGLVHAAGSQMTKPLKALNLQDLQSIFNINVHAGALLVKGFRHPQVRAESSSIVLLSSVMGLVGAPGRVAYGGTKGAVEAMVRSLALELGPEKIRVNCVAPGFVKSAMLAAITEVLSEAQITQIESMHPLGFGMPGDVAKAIAFLLGATASWITGSTLVIDGGYTAH